MVHVNLPGASSRNSACHRSRAGSTSNIGSSRTPAAPGLRTRTAARTLSEPCRKTLASTPKMSPTIALTGNRAVLEGRPHSLDDDLLVGTGRSLPKGGRTAFHDRDTCRWRGEGVNVIELSSLSRLSRLYREAMEDQGHEPRLQTISETAAARGREGCVATRATCVRRESC